MSDRKRSKIWTQFDAVDSWRAECRLCRVKISYRAGSTNNLHRHLRIVHPSAQLDEKRQPAVNEGASASTATAAAPPSSTASPWTPGAAARSSVSQFLLKAPEKHDSTDEELAKMIARDFRPLSIVDDKGFRSFTRALDPMYSLPSKKTLSQIISGLYDQERASLLERVKRATAVCLTTDSWTSRSSSSYMSVTCHFVERFQMASCLLDCFEFSDRHTPENLSDKLLKVAREWGVADKVVCCVSDNSASVAKAVKALKWTHLPCLAHTINFFVRDALKVMKPTVDKVKAIVEFFHGSTAAAEKLESTQRQMGVPELKLKQKCATRWNSTLRMLKQILDSKDAVISTLDAVNAPVDPLCQEDWEAVREACAVLEPFEQVAAEISADSYVTASKMLILCKGLQTLTAEHKTRGSTGKAAELVDALCASMERKFHRIEYNAVLSETTILDPRFKELAFSDNRAVDEALQRITAAAAAAAISSRSAAVPEAEEAAEQVQEKPRASAVWRFFEERATDDASGRNPAADVMLEVKSYLEEPFLQRSADPLSWWESKRSVYPSLTHVMERRLCIAATSVPSERVFSKAGQIITERRNRIKPSKLRHLVFLNANLS